MSANTFIILFCLLVGYIALRRWARARSGLAFTKRMHELAAKIKSVEPEPGTQDAIRKAAPGSYALKLANKTHQVDIYWLFRQLLKKPKGNNAVDVPAWVNDYRRTILFEVVGHTAHQSPLLLATAHVFAYVGALKQPVSNLIERLARAIDGPQLPSDGGRVGRLAA